MDDYLPGFKIMFKYTFILLIVICVPLIWYYSRDIPGNKFIIKINDTNMLSRIDVEHRDILFVQHDGSFRTDETNIFENKLELNNKIELSVLEYEVYNRYGNRKNYQGSCNNCTYESVNIGTKTMMVQRLGKIIYEGEYESNLSNIITEKGRYYFHIYTKTKKGFLPTSYIKSDIHFTVLIGDIDE